MAHKTLIDGTSYTVMGGNANINGPVYSLHEGKAKIDGTDYTIPFDKPFSECTVGEIIAYCQSGHIPSCWAVGDTNNFVKAGQNQYQYPVVIIGMNHDDYADGSGKAPVTFQFQYMCPRSTKQMHTSSSIDGCWRTSTMRTTTLPTIIDACPDNVRTAIREVLKPTAKTQRSAELENTADKLFLLSEYEYYGTTSQTSAIEGEQYEYYYTNSPQKRLHSEGSTVKHWTRSPVNSTSTKGFCVVGTDGKLLTGYRGATQTYYISPAFCF